MALTERWMELIGRDAHNDRDCHFSIEKRWSYGERPTYHVIHEGYVWEEQVDETFRSSTAAHRFLAALLAEMVAKEETE